MPRRSVSAVIHSIKSALKLVCLRFSNRMLWVISSIIAVRSLAVIGHILCFILGMRHCPTVIGDEFLIFNKKDAMLSIFFIGHLLCFFWDFWIDFCA